jgi:hypothetical protein
MQVSAKQNHRQGFCFARRHMSPAASAYHAYALAVSRGSAVFYSDDRRDAKEFGEDGISYRTIYGLRRFLDRAHWFVRIDKGSRVKRNPKTGTFESIRYRVLSHDEWAAEHPGFCRFTRQEKDSVSPDANIATGPDAEIATGEDATSCNSLPHQLQIPTAPVAIFAAKTVTTSKNANTKTERETSTPSPYSPPKGDANGGQSFASVEILPDAQATGRWKRQNRITRRMLSQVPLDDLRFLTYEQLDAIDSAPPYAPNRTTRQQIARSLKSEMMLRIRKDEK